MTQPVRITFRNKPASPALEQEIRSRVAWLETFYGGIVGSKVTLEIPHRHRERGRPVQVRIELSVPGEDIVVSHAPTLHASSRQLATERLQKELDVEGPRRDALVAVHDAFDVARRRLEDYARRQRGDVKSHVVGP
jgi:hypothetical protein